MLPRIDPLNQPYRPKLIYPKEKVDELFTLINSIDTQQIKQYSIINSITLNVEELLTGNNLIHKVLLLNDPLKNEFHKLNMIKFLVNNDVNPDKPNKENQTPLHLACKYQYSSIVKYLVDNEVDINYQDNNGYTPFHYALQGNIKVIEPIKDVNDLVTKNAKTDYQKIEKLVEIKKLIWEKLIDNEFINAIKSTLYKSLKNNTLKKTNIISLLNKLSEKILSLDKNTDNKIIIAELENIKNKAITDINKEWGNFKSTNNFNLEIHTKTSSSWNIDDIIPYSPLKEINLKKEIKIEINTIKKNIIENCKLLSPKTTKIVSNINTIINTFYTNMITNTNFPMATLGNTRILNIDLNTNWNNWINLNNANMHPSSNDYADNIINWQNLTFIGGSRDITITYDFNTIIRILNYPAITDKIKHILYDLDQTYNISINPIMANNINHIIYNLIVVNYFKSILTPYIFSRLPPTPELNNWANKWDDIIKTKKSSAIYTLYSDGACKQSNDNLTGTMSFLIPCLVNALQYMENNNVNNMSFEIILNACFKKYFIYEIFRRGDKTLIQKLYASINVLFKQDNLDIFLDFYFDVTIDSSLFDIINNFVTTSTLNDKEKHKKQLFEYLRVKLHNNGYDFIALNNDINAILLFINNNCVDNNPYIFDINEINNIIMTIDGIPIIPQYTTKPLKNNFNKIIHLLKSNNKINMIIPLTYYYLDLEQSVSRAIDILKKNKILETFHLGLHYNGLIPKLNNNLSIDISGNSLLLAPQLIPFVGPLIRGISRTYLDNTFHTFNGNNISTNEIPLIGNYVNLELSPVTILDTLEKRYNYFLYVDYKYRPPINTSYNLWEEQNKNYLLKILKYIIWSDKNDRNLSVIINSNKNLSTIFLDIYPRILIINDLLSQYSSNKDILINNVIENLNKYNGNILLYFYLFTSQKMYKLSNFNYYQIPKINDINPLLYFDNGNNILNNDILLNMPIVNPSSIIPSNEQDVSVISSKMHNINNSIQTMLFNISKGVYEIKNEDLVHAKDESIPPALINIYDKFYEYNIRLLLINLFDDIKKNPLKYEDIFTKIINLTDEPLFVREKVNIYYIIGKLIQEIVEQNLKNFIQTNIFKIIKEENISIPIDNQVIGYDKFSHNLNVINFDIIGKLLNHNPLLNYYQFSKVKKIDDNNENIIKFVIYPEEYANSELLNLKYELIIDKNIFKELVMKNANIYMIDSNNQSAIFPIIKMHNFEIINLLKADDIDYNNYSDISPLKYLLNELDNHTNKLTNNTNNFSEWLSYFVFYQKNINNTLILSNDKYGNNLPKYLEDSYEIIFYLINQYLSESIYKIEDITILTEIKSLINYNIPNHKKYLFINENLDKINNIYEDVEDNIIIDIIDDIIQEKENITYNINKLGLGNTRKILEDKVKNLDIQITELQKLLQNLLPNSLLVIESSKILQRYNNLSINTGTMTKLLSKMVKLNLNESFDLITFKIIDNEKYIDDKEKLRIINNFYKYTNKISDIYFDFNKYCDTNKVLTFVKELLEFMTKHYIIFPYIMILRGILNKYFSMMYPLDSYNDINNKINYCLNYENIIDDKISIRDQLENIIVKKIVTICSKIFNNSNDEFNFNDESIKTILDNICEQFKYNVIFPIDAGAHFFVITKEINDYFDTFILHTIKTWQVVIENTFKFNINQGRIIRSIYNLI